jgi:hypothetical protein
METTSSFQYVISITLGVMLNDKGFKNFNTGGVVSDLTVLEGVYEGTDSHIFAFAPTHQAGIQFAVSICMLTTYLC